MAEAAQNVVPTEGFEGMASGGMINATALAEARTAAVAAAARPFVSKSARLQAESAVVTTPALVESPALGVHD
jgi:hypothetical protein